MKPSEFSLFELPWRNFGGILPNSLGYQVAVDGVILEAVNNQIITGPFRLEVAQLGGVDNMGQVIVTVLVDDKAISVAVVDILSACLVDESPEISPGP